MRHQDVHDDELSARLHEAAEGHEPDRARILARLERGMVAQSRPDHRATRPPVFGWVRVVSATAAVASVLAIGGYAVASAVKGNSPAEQTVSVSPTPTPTPSPDATSRTPVKPVAPTHSSGSDDASQKSPKSSTSPTAKSPTASASTPVLPPASGTQDGPLWSDGSIDPGSNDFWAQSDVTLKTTKQLTSLTVQLKVKLTGGVTSAGAWRSLPEQDFTQTVTEQDGFLVYTWVLKEGRTVAVGEWVFAGQYNHDRGGRDAKDDSYSAAGTAVGQQLSVKGDFAATKS
ncbi:MULTISPECIES: hypothetical protein [unclassified Streptomyces]|uniref:hypothetical protein n=1 Tax=unclassified Streptomyces TaxID=2593676 RepID=UPI00190E5581|nr:MULTISPECIES: hypothetical protein [unclassified Streptomyces]MBK3567628.1 hypothetical protein [Streptomyces sp. MBT62]MBK6012783.1 hypothetical protein [Streptomyces sp. MBT53]